MQINAKNLQTLFTSVNTVFKNTFDKARDDSWTQFAYRQPMTTGIMEMPFLEQVAGMREWIDKRAINRLSADKLTVKARKFEETIGISRDDLEDDQYGLYRVGIEQLSVSAARLPNDLCEELLANAASATWCDGAAFFGTTRKYGKATISNYTTGALTEANFKTAWNAMTAYKGHTGTTLKVKPTLLVHGPALHWTVNELFEQPVKADNGATVGNPLYHIVNHLELPGLAGNKWFLFAASGVYKPVFYFERKAPDTLVRKDRPEDDNVFFDGELLYGVDGRASAAFVMPHLAYFGNAS
jgi:phage major head subunit gpT-like protein